MITKKTMKNTNKYLLYRIDNELIPLIQTQRSHIDTLKKFIYHIQTELKILRDTPKNPISTEECVGEMMAHADELIFWIDKLKEYEK